MSEERCAIVTGASRGIGAAVAMELASRGVNVAVNYRGNRERAEAVAQMCREKGVKAMTIQADVAEEAACAALFAQVTAEWKRVDILVNNAGVTADGLLVRMKTEEFDRVVDTNLRGVFFCLREGAKVMMKQRYGRIVNISSVVGVHGNAGQVNYAAAKAGVIGMTKSLAKELGARGVTVNAVAPGFITTEMTDGLTEAVKARLLAEISMRRAGSAEDVAQAVAFLASEAAGYITGQVLGVDGGMGM